jgi:hypothetical protein
MNKIQKLNEINEELYEDYGWCLDLKDLNTTNLEEYKTKMINEFTSKCCNDLLLEGTDSLEVVKRVLNV